MIESGAEIYQRAGSLVRPIIEDEDAAHGRKTKVGRLKEYDADFLQGELDKSARWVKRDGRTQGNAFRTIDAPLKVARLILAREGKWEFPVIRGLITTPTMKADGTIIDQPGYDRDTGLLLVAPPPMEPIPDAPTREEALASVTKLKGLLTEFPFADDAGREDVSLAVALSALITPILRAAFPLAPMHITRAPVAGTGKSYLNDVVAAIAIGQPMPVIIAGQTEEETEKRLVTALRVAQPLISIDNVNGELSGAALAVVTERPSVKARILGKSEEVRIDARGTTIFATGNNILVPGEIVRRTISVTLDSGQERPEERQFAGNPVEAVMADRGAFIRAALIIGKAYITAGRPRVVGRLASFERWSDTVRSALIWLGERDPVASMDAVRAEDPRKDERRDLLSAWANVIGVGRAHRLTLADVLEIANEKMPDGTLEWRELQAAIEVVCGSFRLDRSTFGFWARDNKNKPVDDLKLMNDTHGRGSNHWWVEGPERPGRRIPGDPQANPFSRV